jgi:2-keto-3-deoxy-L-rhamnonate aldolase RhmA
METAEGLVRAADAVGLIPFIRVSHKEPTLVMKALDMGAQGVVYPGVDVVMMGPFDLSVTLGVGGQVEHPLVMESFQRMIDVAASRKVALISEAILFFYCR